MGILLSLIEAAGCILACFLGAVAVYGAILTICYIITDILRDLGELFG